MSETNGATNHTALPADKFISLLENGLEVMKKVLDQGVTVTRQEMMDLVNFEVAVKMVIEGQKAVAGKSLDQILKMREELEAQMKSTEQAA